MNMREAIVRAGGSGARLHPIAHAASRPSPLCDKPTIRHPLTAPTLAGVRAIASVATRPDRARRRRARGDGPGFRISLVQIFA